MTRVCLCGSLIDGDEECCSDRCRAIVEGLDSDLGHEMGYTEAVIYFGGVWDQEHSDD